MSNFSIYLIGFCLLIAGLVTAAVMMNAPPMWIGIGAVILLGVGVMTGISQTRIRESSSADEGASRIVVNDGD